MQTNIENNKQIADEIGSCIESMIDHYCQLRKNTDFSGDWGIIDRLSIIQQEILWEK